MPTEPTSSTPDDAHDIIHDLLAALHEPAAINPGLAQLLTQQLQAILDQEPTSPTPD